MSSIEKSKNERWFSYARVQWLPRVPAPLDSEKNNYLRGLRRQIDFDPSSTWEKVHCPVLVLLGELDANAPSKLSAQVFERGLKQSRNRDYTVKILPKANHGLFEAVTGYSSEAPLLKRYVPEYMDGIAAQENKSKKLRMVLLGQSRHDGWCFTLRLALIAILVLSSKAIAGEETERRTRSKRKLRFLGRSYRQGKRSRSQNRECAKGFFKVVFANES